MPPRLADPVCVPRPASWASSPAPIREAGRPVLTFFHIRPAVLLPCLEETWEHLADLKPVAAGTPRQARLPWTGYLLAPNTWPRSPQALGSDEATSYSGAHLGRLSPSLSECALKAVLFTEFFAYGGCSTASWRWPACSHMACMADTEWQRAVDLLKATVQSRVETPRWCLETPPNRDKATPYGWPQARLQGERCLAPCLANASPNLASQLLEIKGSLIPRCQIYPATSYLLCCLQPRGPGLGPQGVTGDEFSQPGERCWKTRPSGRRPSTGEIQVQVSGADSSERG